MPIPVRDALTIVQHPLIQVKMTELRDHRTNHGRFRSLLNEIAGLMVYECTRDLPTSACEVTTPLEECAGSCLTAPVTLVPVLRAGLGMTEGILVLMPEAKVGHLGFYRDEETLKPVRYYEKLPANVADGPVFVVDPMLATGGSAIEACRCLRARGCGDVRLIGLVVAPEGVRAFAEVHPGIPIFTAALDRELNHCGFSLPGLGDAGDRIFGTH